MTSTEPSEWMTVAQAWDRLVERRPELGLRGGYWACMNWMRPPGRRAVLVEVDAIRRVNGRHWIAHAKRFEDHVFELATTGHASVEKLRRLQEVQTA